MPSRGLLDQDRLVKFLVDITQNATRPLTMIHVMSDYKEIQGHSVTASTLRRQFRQEIAPRMHEMEEYDDETKVKLIFATSTVIDPRFLAKLQKEADVEVDGNNRITKYKAKDGSLELGGDHSRNAKVSEPKTPGSVKRSAVGVPNSSKKPRTSSPNHSARIRESRAREQPPKIQQLRQPKLEETSGARTRQEAPGAHIPQEKPIKTEPPGEDDAYTPQIKFLETIHSLVLYLEMPILSALQTKIDEKLRESPNVKITNEELILVIELLVAKIAKHSMLNLAENVESVRFSDFLCYLKSAILHSKLEGLEDLLEKIKDRIKEPDSKDKNIPVEKVASALQHALDGISF